jgi:hypothetical protein
MGKANRHLPLRHEAVLDLVDDVFGDDLHAKRVLSLTNATIGAIASGSLAIHAIGAGLAQAQELDPKHCIKQVDRLLSNKDIVVWDLFNDWVPFIVGTRKEILVILDWTDFDRDGHTTLVMSMVTGHGRGTPLIWKSVQKTQLKDARNSHEDEVVMKLREILPRDIKVTILADRGFADTAFFGFIRSLGFHYLIRIRENFEIGAGDGNTLPAFMSVPLNGRSKSIKGAFLTTKQFPVEHLVLVKKRDMKDPWCLATSRDDLTAAETIDLYAKRWGIETVFRDIKDLQFGMGMKKVRTKSTERRDRLFLISALAISLLVLLGAAGESVGLERKIKANTVKTRSYSLWRQGCMYYLLLPGMKVVDATLLINKFHELLAQHQVMRKILGIL